MILVVDNYDSFTYNLVQILLKQKWPVKIIKSDEWDLARIRENLQTISSFLISPGPGHPRQAQLSLQIVQHFSGLRPILGICLGHQVIAQSFGARVSQASQIMHGKISKIVHSEKFCFQNISQNIRVVRYHSLLVEEESLPADLEVTAWSVLPDGKREIMGLRHKRHATEGLQFHPESILTEQGENLVLNFFNSEVK